MQKFIYALLIVILAVVGWKIFQSKRIENINNQAVGLIEAEQYEEAVILLTEALQIKPDHKIIRKNLAEAYGNMGQHDKAKAIWPAYQPPDDDAEIE